MAPAPRPTLPMRAVSLKREGIWLWTQWIWRDPFGASCDKLSIVCQPTACAPFTPHAAAIGPLIKYLGGDIANVTAPIPAPSGTMLCRCIASAKKICAGHLDPGSMRVILQWPAVIGWTHTRKHCVQHAKLHHRHRQHRAPTFYHLVLWTTQDNSCS